MPQRLESEPASKKSPEQECKLIFIVSCLRKAGYFMSITVLEKYEFGLEHSLELELMKHPEVVSIPDLDEDEALRIETENIIRTIGSLTINVELEQFPQSNNSLLSAIKRAADGDKEAKAMVSVNVGSDFSERIIKAGEVTKYYLDKNTNGKLEQYGQLYSDIYTNTLQLTPQISKMRPRAEAEARNASRVEFFNASEKLNDNYMVVFSLVPDDMTDTELKRAGFFTETKTMSIQVTTAEEGRVSVESAFVAGKPKKESERQDKHALIKLAKSMGIDYSNLNTTEILDTPILIPKALMPNGVIDLVEQFDDCNGGTFFGEAKPRLDYQEFRRFCDERRESFESDKNEVVKKLINEARTIKTQVQATEKLAELSEAQMVKRAIRDKSIDVYVFGEVSAKHIESARLYWGLGDYDRFRNAEESAITTADSGSCPSSIGRQSDIDIFSINTNKSNEDQKDCEFVSKKCPVCKEKNAKTKVKKGVYYHVGKSCRA